jgi:hypothetical protein
MSISDDEFGRLLQSTEECHRQSCAASSVGRAAQCSGRWKKACATALPQATWTCRSARKSRPHRFEETAASMEQLTSTVQRNASNAEEASAHAKSTGEAAQQGEENMTQAVAAMDSISEAAEPDGRHHYHHRRDRLSDQLCSHSTPRLKPHGLVSRARGFAVVATEVRGLAQRSADSALGRSAP